MALVHALLWRQQPAAESQLQRAYALQSQGELQSMLSAVMSELGYTFRAAEADTSAGGGSRYTTAALVFGQPVDAARGLAFFCDVADAELNRRKAAGVDAIREEVRRNGTDVDRECLAYVLECEAGSSELAFQGGSAALPQLPCVDNRVASPYAR